MSLYLNVCEYHQLFTWDVVLGVEILGQRIGTFSKMQCSLRDTRQQNVAWLDRAV